MVLFHVTERSNRESILEIGLVACKPTAGPHYGSGLMLRNLNWQPCGVYGFPYAGGNGASEWAIMGNEFLERDFDVWEFRAENVEKDSLTNGYVCKEDIPPERVKLVRSFNAPEPS